MDSNQYLSLLFPEKYQRISPPIGNASCFGKWLLNAELQVFHRRALEKFLKKHIKLSAGRAFETIIFFALHWYKKSYLADTP